MPGQTVRRVGHADPTRQWTAAAPGLSLWGSVAVAPGVWILPSSCLPSPPYFPFSRPFLLACLGLRQALDGWPPASRVPASP